MARQPEQHRILEIARYDRATVHVERLHEVLARLKADLSRPRRMVREVEAHLGQDELRAHGE